MRSPRRRWSQRRGLKASEISPRQRGKLKARKGISGCTLVAVEVFLECWEQEWEKKDFS